DAPGSGPAHVSVRRAGLPTTAPTENPADNPARSSDEDPADAPGSGPAHVSVRRAGLPTTAPTENPADNPARSSDKDPTDAPASGPDRGPDRGPAGVPARVSVGVRKVLAELSRPVLASALAITAGTYAASRFASPVAALAAGCLTVTAVFVPLVLSVLGTRGPASALRSVRTVTRKLTHGRSR
ncbi:hypothetical protein ACIF9R_36970, partial [Streptomyces sp. NPDC086080]